MKNKYIIGNGISGLIWKFYHPGFEVIAPSLAGGLYAKAHLAWLHDCFETRKLLTDLDIPFKIKKSKIGYFHDGWIADSVSSDMNLLMIQKKMTEWNKSIDTNFVPKTRDLSLSAGGIMGTNYMNTIDVDLELVIEKLNKDINTIDGLVTQIDEKEIFIQTDKSGAGIIKPYDKLISTIAAPFFWKAWGTPKEFKCLPITNVIVKDKPKEFDDRYEMIYYDSSVPFSRVSHMGDTYALEFTGVMTETQFRELFPRVSILEYFVIPQGRIFENEQNYSPSEKITFSGRFAQWKYGIVTENVLDQAINYNDKKI